MADSEKSLRPGWFVQSNWGGADQMERFLSEGIWEWENPDNIGAYSRKDSYMSHVRSMQPGDRIAIKSCRTQGKDLPFDYPEGRRVGVMKIKAVGTITENPGDGMGVRVDWADRDPQLDDWYFFIYFHKIWRVDPGEWWLDNLLAFAFAGEPQDIDRFRKDPAYALDNSKFSWTSFYENVAEKLLAYQFDRGSLVAGIKEIAQKDENLSSYFSCLYERYEGAPEGGSFEDIDPFTVMGVFNRGISDKNRKIVGTEIAKFLGVEDDFPESLGGIPVFDNRSTRLYDTPDQRGDGDIDAFWRVAVAANQFFESGLPEHRAEFVEAYDAAMQIRWISWNLTMGLFWARPWDLLTLDRTVRDYITKVLGWETPVNLSGSAKPPDAEGYLGLMDHLKERFEEGDSPINSFPDLSLKAWEHRLSASDEPEPPAGPDGGVPESYSIDNVLSDGCFLSREEIENLLDRLRTKKNLILQGPPGTGKTWIARRLAFALMGERNDNRIRAVQFHPNLSYEDFVRGWRPSGDGESGGGRLRITDGVFMEAINRAAEEPESEFVVVIEEINRGNPAQIFGEMLTLLEGSKRKPEEALKLSYPDADGSNEPVHIPENLYVIGTMNTADRSLALIDFALRRRFAFATLEPKLGNVWRGWATEHCGIDPELAPGIERRINALNQTIGADLGKQFQIGHSYVTPERRIEAGATRDWFLQVVDTEIRPLLEEYWFDSPEEANGAVDELLAGW